MFRNFIRAGNSCKLRNFSFPRSLIQSFYIPLFTLFNGSADINFPKTVSDNLFAFSRSCRYGEINAVITIRPASFISFATSAIRRIFSTRSSSENQDCCLSPSAHYLHPKASFFSHRIQTLLQCICYCRLSCTGQSAHPDGKSLLLHLLSRFCLLISIICHVRLCLLSVFHLFVY